jgi:DNA transposition AAA+ family ATPase
MSTTPENELQTLARDILEWAECNDITKADLIRQHPGLGSDKTLGSIASGKLAELDIDKWLAAYRQVAADLIPEAEEDSDPLYEDLSTAKRVRAEFTRLKMSRTNAKLLIVEGATGMGKTSAGRIIERKMRELNPVAHLYQIEASAGWGDRPNAMFSAILKALGMPDSSRSQAARLEKLIEALQGKSAVIIIDEVHDFGGRCLRAIKTLLNQTPVKIVMLTHPRLFRDLERENWDDVSQLTGNRLLARIALGNIRAEDVVTILQRRVPSLNGTTKDAAVKLATAANGNGNFAFVREIIVRLKREEQKTRTAPNAESIDRAIRAELQARKSFQISA